MNFKDPLAVTPSKKEKASILSGESPRQNFRGIFFFYPSPRITFHRIYQFGYHNFGHNQFQIDS